MVEEAEKAPVDSAGLDAAVSYYASLGLWESQEHEEQEGVRDDGEDPEDPSPSEKLGDGSAGYRACC